MHAWQVVEHGEPVDALRLVEIAPPEPAPTEVRVRVGAAALGLPDVLMCRGSYPLTPVLPFTPGQEVAGIVTCAGAQTRIAVGTRVMAVTSFFAGHGGFAEETLAMANSTFPVPAEMRDVEAAGFFIAYHTAWAALVQRGGLQPGERLLVLGAAGGTGAAAISVGRALGAQVIAAAGGADKGAYCRSQGAHAVIDHQAESLPEAVAAVTGGHGVDLIFDPVGGAVSTAAVQCLANEGRLLVVGFASGAWVTISLLDAVMRNYSVVGVMGAGRDHARDTAAHAELLRLYREGLIRTAPTRTAPFDQLPNALQAVADRKSLGRIVVVP
jgi:NADPH:quinone reductase